MDVDDVYLQQDGAGATCHTSGETIGLLREKFPGRVISRNGVCNWPPRSCDLTPPQVGLSETDDRNDIVPMSVFQYWISII